MNKSTLFLKLFIIIFAIVPLFNGCKKDKGSFVVYRITVNSQRDFIKDTSYIALQGQFASETHIAGKLSYWEFEIFDKDDTSIMKISSENYKTLSFELDVTSTSAPGYGLGSVLCKPATTINGDIFNELVPAKVIFRADVIDQNDFESQIVAPAAVNHYIIKEQED